jgi:hypothetical protein
MREPRRLTTVWAFTACYRDIFTFLLYYYYLFVNILLGTDFNNVKFFGHNLNIPNLPHVFNYSLRNNMSYEDCRYVCDISAYQIVDVQITMLVIAIKSEAEYVLHAGAILLCYMPDMRERTRHVCFCYRGGKQSLLHVSIVK